MSDKPIMTSSTILAAMIVTLVDEFVDDGFDIGLDVDESNVGSMPVGSFAPAIKLPILVGMLDNSGDKT